MKYGIISAAVLDKLVEIGEVIFHELKYEIYCTEIKIDYIFKNVKTVLKQYKRYIQKLIITHFIQNKRLHYKFISLFYGLCCSSPGFIFNAITGNNSIRISFT